MLPLNPLEQSEEIDGAFEAEQFHRQNSSMKSRRDVTLAASGGL